MLHAGPYEDLVHDSTSFSRSNFGSSGSVMTTFQLRLLKTTLHSRSRLQTRQRPIPTCVHRLYALLAESQS